MHPTTVKLATPAPKLTTSRHLGNILRWSASDPLNTRYRTQLYRFLTDQIPLINAAIWTWVRLSAAPGSWKIPNAGAAIESKALARLETLNSRLFGSPHTRPVSIDAMLPDLFATLFRDGLFGGILTVAPDASSVDRFIPIDPADIIREDVNGKPALFLERDTTRIPLDRPDFYYIPFAASISEPFGRSILQAIPFVAYIEQQLVDDMRRSSHNAGFHRLHVKITPPERISGESDQAYTERINEYFDATVEMIRSLRYRRQPGHLEQCRNRLHRPRPFARRRQQLVHVPPRYDRGYLRRRQSRSVPARLLVRRHHHLVIIQIRRRHAPGPFASSRGFPLPRMDRQRRSRSRRSRHSLPLRFR